jgi:predicted Rossmann fold flavoprotein
MFFMCKIKDTKGVTGRRSTMKKLKRPEREGTYDLVIIGAGPAGMMASLSASRCGARVLLVEKNRIPGVKLLLTGKERCNITNAEGDVRKFAAQYGKKGRFLLNALFRFGVKETVDFFNRNQLKTVVERGGRIFPESNTARDVHDLFLRLMKQSGVTVLTGTGVKRISSSKNSVERVVLADDTEVRAGQYVICTGGCSYPETGSTGDGYSWAQQMGHSIVRPEPALTPIVVKEKWVKDVEGLSLKNVSISVYQKNRKELDRFGEAIFTGFGLSGPIILDMSKSIGTLLRHGETELFIDLKPALSFPQLDRRILREFDSRKNRSVKNVLPELIPKKLIPVILELAGIVPDKKSHSITRDERKRLLKLLKQIPLSVKEMVGFGKAIITAGGVSLKEVDPGSMRSRIIENLYFAGEILDLDGPTGGYNLQVCWSTGYLAGEHAALQGASS